MAAGTITYRYPVITQGATPPTALQSRNASMVVADLAMSTQGGGTEDATAIVHNLDLTPADGTLGIPEVDIVPIAQGTALTLPKITFTDKDTLTVAKALTAANTSVTWRITIRRPHTIDR